jgi:hypothetical protein
VIGNNEPSCPSQPTKERLFLDRPFSELFELPILYSGREDIYKIDVPASPPAFRADRKTEASSAATAPFSLAIESRISEAPPAVPWVRSGAWQLVICTTRRWFRLKATFPCGSLHRWLPAALGPKLIQKELQPKPILAPSHSRPPHTIPNHRQPHTPTDLWRTPVSSTYTLSRRALSPRERVD